MYIWNGRVKRGKEGGLFDVKLCPNRCNSSLESGSEGSNKGRVSNGGDVINISKGNCWKVWM